jgi:very-short-patch-repair endonuclease
MLWRDEGIVVECDGFEAHSGHLRWKRDRRRCAAIEALGLRIVHITWDDVTGRPDETVERLWLAISEASRRRPAGWRFPLVRGRG